MTQKDFKTLGKMVFYHQPENAKQLLAKINEQCPGQTDFSLMHSYFKEFCQHRDYIEEPKVKYKRSRKNLAHLKVFIAAMIQIYCPEAFQFRKTGPMKKGFSKQLGLVIGHKVSNISHMISEVVVRQRVYDSFREDVQQFVQIIQKNEQ